MENLLVLGYFWFKFWGGGETYLVTLAKIWGTRPPVTPSPAIYAHERSDVRHMYRDYHRVGEWAGVDEQTNLCPS